MLKEDTMDIICESCSTENLSTSTYCKCCGNLLQNTETLKCSHCNTYNPDTAVYCKNCGNQLFSKQKPKTEQGVNKPKFIVWILVMGLIISIAVCVALVNEKNYWQTRYGIVNADLNSKTIELSSVSKELNSVNNKLSSTNNELNSIKSELDKIDSPIVISKIEVRNSGENYNQIIYSANTTYINGKIYFFSTKSQTITLNIKFYKNNVLSQGSGQWYHSNCSYPITFSTSAYYHSTFECNGWGNKTKGHWTPGDYRYEVWYGDRCLGVKCFTVY
ncbi:MAG: zinc ribbon domain-containing protein [Bacteroidales bacterium]|nr:zinc ribbon domain-containing protein [Bacteroidales bacterium]